MSAPILGYCPGCGRLWSYGMISCARHRLPLLPVPAEVDAAWILGGPDAAVEAWEKHPKNQWAGLLA